MSYKKLCPVCGDAIPIKQIRSHVVGTKCLAEAERMGRYWDQVKGEKLVSLVNEIDKILNI
jgi:reverse gyrase